jgi:hypothetical protein
MKKIKIIAIGLLLLTGLITSVEAEQRFFYTKPEYRGRIIDNETKEPIGGVVVVTIYWEEYSFCLNPGGCNGDIIRVKETLTDSKGEFHIAPYKTLIQPFGYVGNVDFIIYKPGYASYPKGSQNSVIKPLDIAVPEYVFSGEMGKPGTTTYPDWHQLAKDNKPTTYFFTFGIAEMPRAKTREERLRAFPSIPTDYRSKELPLLFKSMNEDNKILGLGEEK